MNKAKQMKSLSESGKQKGKISSSEKHIIVSNGDMAVSQLNSIQIKIKEIVVSDKRKAVKITKFSCF